MTEELKDNTVIVVDNSNYKSEYAEEVPFKAQVVDKYEINIVVISLKTKKRYELYLWQILECFNIEEIRKLLKNGTE